MKKFSLKAAAAAAALMICIPGAAAAVTAAEDTAVSQDTAPVQQKDTYEIGSVSKAVCAVACCKLADEGKLDLNAPITKYIPEFKMKDERYKDITVRMLLDHTSGIMGNVEGWYLSGDGDTQYHDNFLDMISCQRLKADPGEYGVYCNSGFELAELVIERITGMDYGDFLQKKLAEPLGLDSFGTGYTGTERDRFIISRNKNNRAVQWINCSDIASGGMWAAAEDLALFGNVLTDGSDFLSAESKAIITDILSDEDGFGLGIDSTKLYPYDLYGKKAVFKGGSLGNFYTSLITIPEDELSVAVCSQGAKGYSTNPQLLAQDIILSVLREEGLISDEDIAKGNAAVEEMLAENDSPEVPIPDEIRKYAGLYGNMGLYNIDFDGNYLVLEYISSAFRQTYRFRHIGDGKFCSSDGSYISSLGSFSYQNAKNRGSTTIWFEEERGKVFAAFSTTEELKGIGAANSTAHNLEKLPEVNVSEKAEKAWADRADNKYYLVQQPYNSYEYLETPVGTIREYAGYVYAVEPFSQLAQHVAVITDEFHSSSETDIKYQGSRDLQDYEIVFENGAEYLRGEAYTMSSYRLDDFADTSSLSGKFALDTPDDAVWFHIAAEDVGRPVSFGTSEKAAWYVYDKNGKCIASSLYLDGSDRVILPADGMVLLTGKSGEYVNVNK